jgi:HMG box factor
MTLSMPDPSSSWDRTLPKPNGILQNLPAGPFTRRISSLLQHHLVSRNLSQETLESDVGRRRTVPCISYHGRPLSGVDGQPRMVDNLPREPALLPSASLETLTRKRDASHMAEEPYSRPDSPSSASAGEGAKEFCLCQPDPKIPRPRNGMNPLMQTFPCLSSDHCVGAAFILYRQHQQAAVVQQHPGLPNPEISKIIGEQWRSLPEKSKSEWKALAEVYKAIILQQRNNELTLTE